MAVVPSLRHVMWECCALPAAGLRASFRPWKRLGLSAVAYGRGRDEASLRQMGSIRDAEVPRPPGLTALLCCAGFSDRWNS